MKFFKLFVILFFVPILLKGQNLPIWESSVYSYNRYSVGKDFYNVNSMSLQNNGSIFIHPYGKTVFNLNNHGYTEEVRNIGTKGQLIKVFEFSDQKLMLFKKSALIQKNNKEILLFESNESYTISTKSFHISSTVYFSLTPDFQDEKIFYSYDGSTLKEIFRSRKKDIFYESFGNEIYIAERNFTKNQTILYDFKTGNLRKPKTYPFASRFSYFLANGSAYYENNNRIFLYDKIKSTEVFNNSNKQNHTSSHYHYTNRELHTFFNLNKKFSPEFHTSITEMVFSNIHSPETASLYLGTSNHLMRAFYHLKKYPRLYNKTNSNQIFSLNQTLDGKIWAGSYAGNISIIEKDKIIESKVHNYRILNGGITYRNNSILNAESKNGILLFKDINNYKKISDTINSFYNYISTDSIFYSGTQKYGLMFKPIKDIENPNVKWKFAGSNEGITLINCLTIEEDKFGNVWTGRSSEGIAVYQPEKNKAKTWLVDKNEISFGSMAMLKDSYGTLWIGTSTGNLVFWNGTDKDDFSTKNFIKVDHPLLSDSDQSITFIHQWKDWLILGGEERILLVDLNSWNKTAKTIVRYLNPVEAAFTSPTEQNTILTDFRDQTVWFSTSDMLYQWDIENWLKLPTYKAIPKIQFKIGDSLFIKNDGEPLKLGPTQNSFDIEAQYQTKDNMPRYISTALIREGEKFVSSNASINNIFKFHNLSSGNYVFHVLVCQQDGTYSSFKFPITIKAFLWQQLWFWAFISVFPILFIFYYFKNKEDIERKKKEIIQLNVSTLSNQFRPHFMLNALNSLGTEMDDKPHAEKVISRIGENINLMYDYSQNKNFYTAFKNEWKLVQNIIEIQKTIFIKELRVEINNQAVIPVDYKLPLGILQVNVENALLHGIRHRKQGPYIITINFSSDKIYYYIEIIDNGVGRENSSKIYDFQRNGTGLKNIMTIIKIINSELPGAIKLIISDNIYTEENYPGTKILIRLMKTIKYEKFKF